MALKQDEQAKAILDALRSHEGGASLDYLAGAVGTVIPRRSLIRRLGAMVEQKSIIKSGVSRAARYYAPPQAKEISPSNASAGGLDIYSKVSEKLLRQIRRRPELRKPVGYQRGFLDAYTPNKTSYLTASEKEKLHRLGRTDSGEKPAGTYAKQVLQRLLIDLSWNSSRLEGNTYSLLDTQRLIDFGEAAEGKGARDAQMILNHKAAIEFLVGDADQIGFNRRTILNLHGLLADGLLGDPSAPGRLRREAIAISGSVYMPLEVPQVLSECFDEILVKATVIKDPFEQSFFIMVQLPYLQPFIDVNKRVSRLAANIPLIRSNLAPLSFVSVDDKAYTEGMLAVYELNRVEVLKDVYLWAYERSSARYAALQQSLGQPDPFRVRHRLSLKRAVADVIRGPMDQRAAARFIEAYAEEDIKEEERARFVEEVETELLGLHEGNFARYQVRPSEFDAWRVVWKGKGRGKRKKPVAK